MVRHGSPEQPTNASPLVPLRLPLSARPAGPLGYPDWSTPSGAGPRPWGTRFAVLPAVRIKHRKRPTHGVTKRATKYIDDGKEHTDSVDEPYEDEVDE